MESLKPNLLIAGGSVRAAAESAVRAGFAPWCVDCFGDVDLVRACPTRVVRDYPKEIPEILASGPKGCGWMYTGAMENHPEIIEAVDRPLYGNASHIVARVRDQLGMFFHILRTKQRAPKLFPAPKVDRWLLKPRRSGGGVGIRFWDGTEFDRDRFFLQEWLEGESMSAVFLAGEFGTVWIGTTRQLTGVAWLHPPEPFNYCGSIRENAPLGMIGEASRIMASLGARGLLGIDLIFRDGEMWPVEVNPRYTASVEIVERAANRQLVCEHIRCLTESEAMPAWPVFHESYPGKAILYAPVDFTFPAAGPWDDDYPFADLRRRFADLPHPGAPIRRGQPVLTFFADGDSPDATEAALRKIAGDLDRLLFGR